METINIKAYTSNSQQIDAIKAFMKALNIKFEVANDSPYDPDFVKKIKNSQKQANEGKTVKIDLDDIRK
ncbi:MAG: hypothetical protein K9H26_06775 [Prolixibacteraceae bacterium]|nr:hypothetical protein [Prolixibacteraceae bacterium]